MEAATSPHISSTASSDRDENYDLYAQNRGLEYTPEEGKRVLRKIDLQLIPLLFVIYMIQYLDKNSINFASVYGLEEGTGLKGQDYSWLGECTSFISPFGYVLTDPGSIFYFGYLIAQWPAGLALQKLPVGKFLGITTIGKHGKSSV